MDIDEDVALEACGALSRAAQVGQAQGLSTTEIMYEMRTALRVNQDELRLMMQYCAKFLETETKELQRKKDIWQGR